MFKLNNISFWRVWSWIKLIVDKLLIFYFYPIQKLYGITNAASYLRVASG